MSRARRGSPRTTSRAGSRGASRGTNSRGGRVSGAEASRRLDGEFQALVEEDLRPMPLSPQTKWQGWDPSTAWAAVYASASDTPAEALAAVAKLDELHITPSTTDWLGPTSRALFLAGRGDQARPLLADTLTFCSSALLFSRGSMRAHLYLGELDEHAGDRASACDHYGKVLDRWGHARPRSITADEARVRAGKLGCGR